MSCNNTNRLVGAKGWNILLSKTGYTDEAGCCLAMRMMSGARAVTVVLLDADKPAHRLRDAALDPQVAQPNSFLSGAGSAYGQLFARDQMPGSAGAASLSTARTGCSTQSKCVNACSMRGSGSNCPPAAARKLVCRQTGQGPEARPHAWGRALQQHAALVLQPQPPVLAPAAL